MPDAANPRVDSAPWRRIASLRNAWFQVHKWLGLALLVLIIPVSLTGSALVWKDWLDEKLNPSRYDFVSSTARLNPSAYARAAARVLGEGDRLATLTMPQHGKPVVITVAPARSNKPHSGPPVRVSIYLDPSNGGLLGQTSNYEGAVRWMHYFHGGLQAGSLGVPSGRQVVGWLGIAMLISCLTGLWLWWPTSGKLHLGLRWRRRREFDANLHHQVGLWTVVPLGMLSLTGAWIVFPNYFVAFVNPSAIVSTPSGGMGMGAASAPTSKPKLTPDAVVGLALRNTPGSLASVNWPIDGAGQWRVVVRPEDSKPVELEVNDSGGTVRAAIPPPQAARLGQLMHRLHDGQRMGIVWQIVIFIAGLVPAILGITGVLMWLRTRKWRAALALRVKMNRSRT